MWSVSSGASTGTRRLLPDPVYSILSAPMAESCNLHLTPATKKVALMGGPCATNCHHNYETVCRPLEAVLRDAVELLPLFPSIVLNEPG